MAQMGRPPKPVEVKRRLGNPGKRPLQSPSLVLALPAADRVPLEPTGLLMPGQELWHRVWTQGISWISPATDLTAVEQACYLLDDLTVARERFRATRDPADGRMVNAFVQTLESSLGRLGFDPSSRSKLGVAEVKAASALTQLLDRRTGRG